MGSWDWDIINGDWIWDDGQCHIFGVDPATFKVSLDSVRPLVAPDDFTRLQEAITKFGSGESHTYQTEFRVLRPDGETRWCYGTATPSIDEHGKLVRVSGVTVDITDRKLAEERQLLLAREVDHRARNALAVVQAIVRLTREPTQQAYVQAVEGRIHALAHAHTLLSQARWKGADVARLVDEELAPYRHGDKNERVRVGGASVLLAPEKAQNLALALHEHATNSAKYGALSTAAGQLNVNWESARGKLTLYWRESGGPPVTPPTTQGFGTKIMNASIKHQMGGNVVMDWRPAGLHCTLQILNEPGGLNPSDAPKSENLVRFPAEGKRRILLVEDEALVGMMMRDILLEHGLFVIGPCCTLSEAMATIGATDVDCAILDLNLGGEAVYPVAEKLSGRGVPFLFITGYGRESIDDKFKGVPVLQKPVIREGLERHLRDMLGTTEPGEQRGYRGGRDQFPPVSA
jgi:PAS domain S-box-containing protein